jgi:glyoxylase-like metal-dependent hydrolase (beta-lactamase superfamily II)
MVVGLRQHLKQSVDIHRIELPTPLPVGTVNAYLLLGGDQAVLVDCGIRERTAWACLEAALAEFGIEVRDLTALVLTHPHVDHVGWAGNLQNLGTPVYSHPQATRWLDPDEHTAAFRERFFEDLYTRCGMPQADRERAFAEFSFLQQWTDRSVVDVPLSEGTVFPPLPQFRVLYVPGHAQAAIALWNEQSGELVVGDQLLPHISSNAIVEPVMDVPEPSALHRTRSLVQYRENLAALRRLQIRRVYPGHGEVFSGADALIDLRLKDQVRRRDQLLDLLKHIGPCPAYELALAYFPQHRHQPSLILSEVLGYLDWAAVDGLASEEVREDGTLEWRAV